MHLPKNTAVEIPVGINAEALLRHLKKSAQKNGISGLISRNKKFISIEFPASHYADLLTHLKEISAETQLSLPLEIEMNS